MNDHCYCQSLPSALPGVVADLPRISGFVRDAVVVDGVAYYECASCLQWWRESAGEVRKVSRSGA